MQHAKKTARPGRGCVPSGSTRRRLPTTGGVLYRESSGACGRVGAASITAMRVLDLTLRALARPAFFFDLAAGVFAVLRTGRAVAARAAFFAFGLRALALAFAVFFAFLRVRVLLDSKPASASSSA